MKNHIDRCLVFNVETENFFIMVFLLMMFALTQDLGSGSHCRSHWHLLVIPLLTISLVVMMTFSGFFVSLRNIRLWFSQIQHISIPQYDYTALKHNECMTKLLSQDQWDTRKQDMCIFSVFWKIFFYKTELSSWVLGGNHLALACTVVIFFIIACFKLVFLGKLS